MRTNIIPTRLRGINRLKKSSKISTRPTKSSAIRRNEKSTDQFGADWKHYEEAGAQPGGFDWSKYANTRGGQSRRTSAQETNEEFSDESVKDLFETLFGQRSGQGRGRRSVALKGQDLETETTLSLEEAYHGTTRLIQLNGQKIKVTIKLGVADNQMLRIAGKGGGGAGGGPNGDLYLGIKIAPHPEFHRFGNDLQRNLPVDLYTALLGGKAQVKTMKNKVTVNIAKGTSNGKELRLRGLGMPVYGKKNEYGDMLVKVEIVLPEHLSEHETELIKELAALRK